MWDCIDVTLIAIWLYYRGDCKVRVVTMNVRLPIYRLKSHSRPSCRSWLSRWRRKLPWSSLQHSSTSPASSAIYWTESTRRRSSVRFSVKYQYRSSSNSIITSIMPLSLKIQAQRCNKIIIRGVSGLRLYTPNSPNLG